MQAPMVVVAPVQFLDRQVAADMNLLAAYDGVARRQITERDQPAAAIGFHAP